MISSINTNSDNEAASTEKKRTGSVKPTAVMFLCSVALAFLISLGRTVSLLFFYDDIGYFKMGAPLPIITNLLYLLTAVAFAAVSFSLLKSEKEIRLPSGSIGYTALIPAAALSVYALNILFKGVGSSSGALLDTLSLVSAAVFAVFFASLALRRTPNGLTVISCIGGILWLALSWLSSYRDYFVPMNSPDKIYFHLACIASALFILEELRSAYLISKPSAYYFSSFMAIVAISASAIPSLIANVCGVFASYSLLFEDLVFTAVLIYAVCRLAFLTLGKQSREKRFKEEKETEKSEKA